MNSLIETLREDALGFHAAGEQLKDADLRSTFEEYSQQHGQFVHELQSQVNALGGRPDVAAGGSVMCPRAWLNIGSTVAGVKSILTAAESGEQSTLRCYEAALGAHLPIEIAVVLRQQAIEVQRARYRLRDLREERR